MSQFHYFPRMYLDLITSEVPDYTTVQDAVGDAANRPSGAPPRRVLDLGTGTGETARRVMARHPDATLVAMDRSADMLEVARAQLGEGVELCCQELEDALPDGPFDVVVSAFAVHHLDAAGKAALFRRVFDVLGADGRFVLADVVVPDDPHDRVTPLDPGEDRPDRLDAQLEWLAAAGFTATTIWSHRDLVVVTADR